MNDDTKFFLSFIAIVGGGFAALALAGNAYGGYQCSQYESVTGKRTHYVQFDECYVETPTGFQRWDEYKARAAASEGLKYGGAQ